MKKLVPRGYYILNEQGAKLSLKAKIDADAYQAQWKLSDQKLSESTHQLAAILAENNALKDQHAKDTQTIKLIKKELFWAHAWKYTGWTAVAVLAAKLLLKK